MLSLSVPVDSTILSATMKLGRIPIQALREVLASLAWPALPTKYMCRAACMPLIHLIFAPMVEQLIIA